MRPTKRNGEMLKRLKEVNDKYKKPSTHINEKEEMICYFLEEILKECIPQTRSVLMEEEKVSK